MKKINTVLIILSISFSSLIRAGEVSIREELIELKTYPYSGQSLLPNFGRVYPYTIFDKYSREGINKKWKAVILENSHIKVTVLPEIGGKVWSAIEKSTGKEFIYGNDVVKFRDIALRGPWVSGGIEFNFGTVGHSQHTASPVDYIVNDDEDGSVSVTVGDYDFSARTRWNVNIRLQENSAFFETSSTWLNLSELPTSFYYWSNAAAKAAGNLEFFATGSNYISHSGKPSDWPINKDGRNISFYDKNNFGSYKSYHVINSYDGFLGGYWHDDDFGFGHLTDYSQQSGRKIWIWGLSRQGNIWEDLLTDNAGQYIEWQSGRFLSQADISSAKTPYRPRLFQPNDTYRTNEYWFPIINTGGVSLASKVSTLNVAKGKEDLTLTFSPLINKNVTLTVISNGKSILNESLSLLAAKPYSKKVSLGDQSHFIISIPEAQLYFDSQNPSPLLTRPTVKESETDWESADGLYSQGLAADSMRLYDQAEIFYNACLTIASQHNKALSKLALLHYRTGRYKTGLTFAYKALQHDTYDAESNYAYGLLNMALGNVLEAKAAFSLASSDTVLRTTALSQLALLYGREGRWSDLQDNVQKSLTFNTENIRALELLAISERVLGNKKQMQKAWQKINDIDPTHHFVDAEKFLLNGNSSLIENIQNELPQQVILELALSHVNLGRFKDAISLLSLADSAPMRDYWLSFLMSIIGNKDLSEKYLDSALLHKADYIFPFRLESITMLEAMASRKVSWKTDYYLALLYISKGRKDEALTLLLKHGSKPNFMPYYAVRSDLKKDKGLTNINDLKLAVRNDRNGWRAYVKLARQLLEDGNFKAALKPAFTAQENVPDMVEAITLYAAALIDNQKYQSALDYLKDKTILPSEHSHSARQLYHLAALKVAYKSLLNKEFNKSIAMAEYSKKWPENLGSGRPYHVDERIADYIKALAYIGKGDNEKATVLFSKVKDMTDNSVNPNAILSSLALQRLGNDNVLNQLKTSNNEIIKSILVTIQNKPVGTSLNHSAELLNDLIAKIYAVELNR